MENVITIVSGLPRSGTSLMMQVLDSGGLEILTDNIRRADLDNPKGYYELEKVKKIKEDASWLSDARGKAFKMVSMLLYDLPKEESYKIVFMKRELDEVLVSQRKMLERQKAQEANLDIDKLRRIYSKHLRETELWLKGQPNMSVIYVEYRAIIENPHGILEKVNEFLGDQLSLEEMAKVVDRSLYRNRATRNS